MHPCQGHPRSAFNLCCAFASLAAEVGGSLERAVGGADRLGVGDTPVHIVTYVESAAVYLPPCLLQRLVNRGPALEGEDPAQHMLPVSIAHAELIKLGLEICGLGSLEGGEESKFVFRSECTKCMRTERAMGVEG